MTRLRLLFVSVPAQGHVRPLLGLALAARRLGHEVAWVSGPDARPVLQPFEMPLFEAGPDFAAALAAFRAECPDVAALPGRQQAIHAFPGLFGRTIARAMLPALQAALDDWRPSMIVSEPAALAAPLAAATHALPHLTHDFGMPIPQALLSAAAEALAPEWRAAGREPPADAGVYAHAAVEIVPAALRIHGARSPCAPMRLAQRPCAITGAPQAPLPASLADFLRRTDGRHRVYASFGTLNRGGPPWQALWDALVAAGNPCIVTTGPFVAPPPPAQWPAHLWAAPYVPQSQVIPHCAAVVSHGGAGIGFAAAAAGLPQLCLPLGADQFRNADALAAAGVARLVEAVDATTIGAALAELRGDAARLAAAAAMRAEFMALPTPEDTAARLAELVH